MRPPHHMVSYVWGVLATPNAPDWKGLNPLEDQRFWIKTSWGSIDYAEEAQISSKNLKFWGKKNSPRISHVTRKYRKIRKKHD